MLYTFSCAFLIIYTITSINKIIIFSVIDCIIYYIKEIYICAKNDQTKLHKAVESFLPRRRKLQILSQFPRAVNIIGPFGYCLWKGISTDWINPIL